MPTVFSMVIMEHIGRWRNTVYAGSHHSSQDVSYNMLIASRDAFTTSSDFIISPHAASEGLYIATCGNFHGWKFFPVIGKYVVQMLEGTLSNSLTEKWAWDRPRPDPALFADWPRSEMNDLLDSNPKL